VIVYKAAAEELKEGEAGNYHCKTLTLEKGKYISETIKDYLKDTTSIGRSFQKLLELQQGSKMYGPINPVNKPGKLRWEDKFLGPFPRCIRLSTLGE
jgi:hypothetical protein